MPKMVNSQRFCHKFSLLVRKPNDEGGGQVFIVEDHYSQGRDYRLIEEADEKIWAESYSLKIGEWREFSEKLAYPNEVMAKSRD